ncbi:MAG: efflux RND transporter periplasmic adaptor subunit, partial [Candidatus Pacebacteria bacterium]|nr:efflux RND transporter periplasmic adaptor subunit [Candidatus Paceibacterota bacterium]
MFKQIIQHKLISAIAILVVIIGVYFGYQGLSKNKNTVRYATAQVSRGTLIVSVSGSGQVSALDQADVKSKVSGDVTYVGVAKDDTVKKGTLLVLLDKTDAQKTVNNAQISLQQTQLALDKMRGTTTDEGTIVGEKEKAVNNLNKAYSDGFSNVANAFLDFPTIMSGLQDILFGYDFTSNQWNIDYYASAVRIYDEKSLQYRDDAYGKYQIARQEYNQNFQDYKSVSRFPDNATMESLINETYQTTKDMSEAIKSIINLIQFYQDKLIERNLKVQSLSNTHLSSLSGYASKTNSYLSSFFSSQNSIQNYKEAVINADFNLQDQEIKLEQAKETLADAESKLADYSIYSPFDGIVASINVENGDSVSGSTVLVNLITRQKIAEISLNEVDAANVKVGQKATLTFDALSDVTLTGKVSDVDTVGTVSQGVVSYGVKIVFDTQDDRVKSGMSVTADIITDSKQDVLLVPNSAVKSQGSSSYVELVEVPD